LRDALTKGAERYAAEIAKSTKPLYAPYSGKSYVEMLDIAQGMDSSFAGGPVEFGEKIVLKDGTEGLRHKDLKMAIPNWKEQDEGGDLAKLRDAVNKSNSLWYTISKKLLSGQLKMLMPSSSASSSGQSQILKKQSHQYIELCKPPGLYGSESSVRESSPQCVGRQNNYYHQQDEPGFFRSGAQQ
jgi:hypothetical protein